MSESQTKGLWERLKKRKVVNVALAYFIIGCLLILIAEVVFQGIALPTWLFSFYLVFPSH